MPVSYFAIGAGIAIVASFVMLSALWTEPRLQGGTRLGFTRRHWTVRYVAVLRVFGVTGLGLVVLAGFVDGTASPLNIAPVLVFVLLLARRAVRRLPPATCGTG